MIGNIRIRSVAVLINLTWILSVFALAEDKDASPKFPSIKCEELKKLIDDKSANILVVSNDPQESFNEGHIPGATSFPWTDDLRPPITLPRNKTLVLYCSCAHEEDSSDMAAKLKVFGYRNIKVLEGGWLQWLKLKYPIAALKTRRPNAP